MGEVYRLTIDWVTSHMGMNMAHEEYLQQVALMKALAPSRPVEVTLEMGKTSEQLRQVAHYPTDEA
jgi:hypothetical protein